MNTLIIYDSQFGNTESIARVIANALSPYGQVRPIHVSQTQPVELKGVNLLIMGSPTQKWGPTLAMRSFLEDIPPESLRELAVAVFDTRFQKPRWMVGSASPWIAAEQCPGAPAGTTLPYAQTAIVTGLRPLVG